MTRAEQATATKESTNVTFSEKAHNSQHLTNRLSTNTSSFLLTTRKHNNMGGIIIDFGTSCPWELYLFAFCHIGGAIVLYLFDSCHLLTSTSCTDAEKVFESFASLSMLYVGVIFTVLTYHNKTSAAKITRLSNFALNGAVAMLCAVIFAGNDAYGGVERCKTCLPLFLKHT